MTALKNVPSIFKVRSDEIKESHLLRVMSLTWVPLKLFFS